MGRSNLNLRLIEQAALEAFDDLNLQLAREYTAAISSDAYEWPVGQSPRDVVDRGQLRASQEMVQLAPGQYQHRWTVEHALYVHEGYTTRGGTEMPARRWTEVAHANFNPQANYNQLLALKLAN